MPPQRTPTPLRPVVLTALILTSAAAVAVTLLTFTLAPPTPTAQTAATVALLTATTAALLTTTTVSRQHLHLVERRFALLTAHSPHTTIETDLEGTILHVNGTTAPFGWGPEQLAGGNIIELFADTEQARQLLTGATSAPAVERQRELRTTTSDGHSVWAATTITDLTREPAVGTVVWQLADRTDRKDLEQALEHYALYDTLTGLPNRTLLLDRLDQAAAVCRTDRSYAALLLLDLDRFATVNDALGHSAGNELLAHVAERLRSTACSDDTVARLDGDRFAILRASTPTAEAARHLAHQLIAALNAPYHLDTAQAHLNSSIGITLLTPTAAEPAQLLHEADVALTHAKADGRGRIAMFDQQLRLQVRERSELEHTLRSSLTTDTDQFTLHYQPIVTAEHHHLASVEALVRWQHPDRGLLSPDRFIPVAEDTGMIDTLGRHVRTQAARQLARWDTTHPGSPLQIATNLSVRELSDPNLLKHTAHLLATTGIDPQRLTLEVTETALLDDLADPGHTLTQLRQLGLKVALDDFGTGYSTLTYLRDLPVDIVKLDRSFSATLDDGHTAAIISGLTQLAHALGLTVVLEGIETDQQADHAQHLGADLLQGFLFSQPVPAHQIIPPQGPTT